VHSIQFVGAGHRVAGKTDKVLIGIDRCMDCIGVIGSHCSPVGMGCTLGYKLAFCSVCICLQDSALQPGLDHPTLAFQLFLVLRHQGLFAAGKYFSGPACFLSQ